MLILLVLILSFPSSTTAADCRDVCVAQEAACIRDATSYWTADETVDHHDARVRACSEESTACQNACGPSVTLVSVPAVAASRPCHEPWVYAGLVVGIYLVVFGVYHCMMTGYRMRQQQQEEVHDHDDLLLRPDAPENPKESTPLLQPDTPKVWGSSVKRWMYFGFGLLLALAIYGAWFTSSNRGEVIMPMSAMSECNGVMCGDHCCTGSPTATCTGLLQDLCCDGVACGTSGCCAHTMEKCCGGHCCASTETCCGSNQCCGAGQQCSAPTGTCCGYGEHVCSDGSCCGWGGSVCVDHGLMPYCCHTTACYDELVGGTVCCMAGQICQPRHINHGGCVEPGAACGQRCDSDADCFGSCSRCTGGGPSTLGFQTCS